MLLKMELVFILFVMDSHCCGIEMQLIFVCSSYDLQICSVCLLLQPVDLWWILFYIYSYAICDTVLLPPFSFGCLYTLFSLSICSGPVSYTHLRAHETWYLIGALMCHS